MTDGASVLVLSHPGDLHATRVLERLRQLGVEAHLVDLSDLPERASLSVDYTDPDRPSATWHDADGGTVDLTGAGSVWWRRPGIPDLSGIGGDALGFAHGEWHEALNGLYQLLDSARWMNRPDLDARASRKALQLRTAARLGLRVPDTLITSNADAARGFIDRHGLGHTVYKIFAATEKVWRETRRVRADDLDKLEALKLAPVIFQEYIPAVADIRITVVGDLLFPMAIAAPPGGGTDFRLNLAESRTSATRLPVEVTDRLRALMKEFGIVYGGIDLRLTPDGQYVFLEVNPAGEFLFCEVGAGFPLTDVVARWLAGERSAVPKSAAAYQVCC